MTVIFDGDSYIRNKKHRINRRRRTLKTHSARTYSTHVPSSPCNKSDRSAPFSKSLGSNPFCFAMSCADQKIRSYKSTTGRTFSSLAHIDSLIIRRTDFESRIHWNRNWKYSKAYGGSQPNHIFRRPTAIDETRILRLKLWIY